MTTGWPKANPGWLFKKTAIWRCEIVMESDTVSYLKVSRGYKVQKYDLRLACTFSIGCPNIASCFFCMKWWEI